MSEDHEKVYLLIFLLSQDLVTLFDFPQWQLTFISFMSIKKKSVPRVLISQGDSLLPSLGNIKIVKWKEMTSSFPTRLVQQPGELSHGIQCRHSDSCYREVSLFLLMMALEESFPNNEQFSRLQLDRSYNGRSNNPAQNHPVPIIFF